MNKTRTLSIINNIFLCCEEDKNLNSKDTSNIMTIIGESWKDE